MAIRVVTGVPGSGKSYYMVNYLHDHYYKLNDELLEWQYKDKSLTVITNIENLKLPHINLDDLLIDLRLDHEVFFSHEYQKKFSEKYEKIIYVIDECQQFFPTAYKNRDVCFYFEKHRHFGHDIFLLTQDIRKLTTQISTLAEFEIRSIPRTITIGGFFYNIRLSGFNIKKIMLRRKNIIFGLYSSFKCAETEKIKNPVLKYLMMVFIAFLVMVYIFGNTPFFRKSNAQAESGKKTVHKISTKGELQKGELKDNRQIKKIDFSVNSSQYHPINTVRVGNELFFVHPISKEILPRMFIDLDIKEIKTKFGKKYYAKYDLKKELDTDKINNHQKDSSFNDKE